MRTSWISKTKSALRAPFLGGWGSYSGRGIVGISQTIVRSRATLIPKWLLNLHSDTVNWFWHSGPEKEGLFWSFQLFLEKTHLNFRDLGEFVFKKQSLNFSRLSFNASLRKKIAKNANNLNIYQAHKNAQASRLPYFGGEGLVYALYTGTRLK